MKGSVFLKQSNIIKTMEFTTSRDPCVAHAEKLPGQECSIDGCLNPATAVLSSAWHPDNQWILCDECQWIVDLNCLGGSSENENNFSGRGIYHPNEAKMKCVGSCQSTSNKSMEKSACILQETTMSFKNNANFVINNTFKKNQEANVTDHSAWHQFEKILSLRKLAGTRRIKKCYVDGCDLDACSLWSTWKRTREPENPTMTLMYVCLDCQEHKFGGWPTLNELLGKGYMTEEKLQIIATRCSKQWNPLLPPAFIKNLV